ncbi:MAG: hypothetical protein ACLFPL_00885 [Candidatus Nanoarchaeia archaeon]
MSPDYTDKFDKKNLINLNAIPRNLGRISLGDFKGLESTLQNLIKQERTSLLHLKIHKEMI